MNSSNPGQYSFKNCHEVSVFCPVRATVLGYYPNLGVNAFLAAAFAACVVGLAVTGFWKRTWAYSATLFLGCILEFAGYIGRIQLHRNPWDAAAFKLQIVTIILAPALICVSIYLTLKHITLSLNPALSRIRPKWYPTIFVPADITCLLLQAIGGGIAASATRDDMDLLATGDRVIITGISLQVVVLMAFGSLSADYFWRVKGWMKAPPTTAGGEDVSASAGAPGTRDLWNDGRFRMFCYAVTGAYSGILIRCIYRIAEMAGGWGNPIMQDEPSFIVLEGFMILIPCILLTVFPPGVLFPAMAERERQRFGKKEKRSNSEATAVSSPGVGESKGDGERTEPKTVENLMV